MSRIGDAAADLAASAISRALLRLLDSRAAWVAVAAQSSLVCLPWRAREEGGEILPPSDEAIAAEVGRIADVLRAEARRP